MSLRFARRPRVRLLESAPPPRKERRKLPSVVLPIAGYWLGMAVLTHAVILVGKGEAAEPSGTNEASARSEANEIPEPPVASPAETAFERTPEEPAETTPVAITPPRVVADEAPPETDLDAPPKLASPPLELSPRPMVSPEPRRAPLALASEDAIERDVERAREKPPLTSPEPAPRIPSEPESPPVSSGLPSCESVLESSSQDMDFDGARARSPDLSNEAFSQVLNHGGYLSSCSIPDGTALDICVAVQAGRVRGVSVQARPGNASVSACVARAAARLRFPHSPHLDIARTHFDALR